MELVEERQIQRSRGSQQPVGMRGEGSQVKAPSCLLLYLSERQARQGPHGILPQLDPIGTKCAGVLTPSEWSPSWLSSVRHISPPLDDVIYPRALQTHGVC